jgi:outer membrane protein, heavy metal efflux system
LRSSELNRQAAEASLLEAKSAFVPKILARPLLLEDYLNESYKRKRAYSFASELIWQSPFGLEIIGGLRSTTKPILSEDGLSYMNSKTVFDSIKKVKLPGFTDDEATIAFRMPLLRGLIIDDHRADLQKAKLQVPIAELSIRQKRADLFLKAGEKYWDWANAGLQYKVAQKLLQLAKERADGIQERVSLGASPPIDYIEVQGQIKNREENLAKARRNLEKEAIGLSVYLWEDENGFVTPIESNLPEILPEPIEIAEALWKEHLKLSVSQRPEFRLLQFENQQEQINMKLARNELLPVVDLEVLPTQDLNRFENSTNIRGSINLEIPLAPLKARSKILKVQTNLGKNALAQNLLKAQITNEVRDALSYVDTSRERVLAAREARDKIGQLAEGEEMRFNFGGSSLFLVNAREVSAAEAENKVLEALADHQKALIRYRYSVGEWSIPDFNLKLDY